MPNIDELCSSDDEKDLHVKNSIFKEKKQNSINKIRLESVAIVCDRYGVSNRAAAAIASSTLQAVGILNESNIAEVIDHNKIKRARNKVRKNLTDSSPSTYVKCIGLYFDGRKDLTFSLLNQNGLRKRSLIREEHISIIGEPEGIYIGHAALQSGSASNIVVGILSKVSDEFLSNVLAIGCDGTAVNTGPKGGVIRLLEEKLNRPLQWTVCLLHMTELPLRHLFKKLDGGTSGPNDFKGVIGKQLQQSKLLPIVSFKKIECDANLPTIDIDMSSDQQYLYDMVQSVSNGICDERTANKNPGNLSHARWLTFSNNILRLYVATEDPSNELIDMAISIKCNSDFANGSKHLFHMISSSRYLREDLRNLVDEVIQRNGFFAHHENILMTMLVDEKKSIRNSAYNYILNARKKITGVRNFAVPKIKLNAKNYINMVDWKKNEITEPPLTHRFTDEDLWKIVQLGPKCELLQSPYFKIPCHTHLPRQ